jgi:hypothetical protein
MVKQLTADILTVHFGHSGWTERLVESVRQCAVHERLRVRTIHIVDNSRDGWICERFQSTSDLVFHEFPMNEDQMKYYFHDHPGSLARGVAESDADILIILDCDAHIIDEKFLTYVANKIVEEGYDAITAPDTRYPEAALSHPCFLVLSRAARQYTLPFDSRVLGSDRDVGRLIRQFLLDKGLRVYVPVRKRPFDGCWGEIFDDQVYHHGSATFRDSKEAEVSKQVDRYAWIFERAILKYRRLHLSGFEKWYLRIHSRLIRLLRG